MRGIQNKRHYQFIEMFFSFLFLPNLKRPLIIISFYVKIPLWNYSKNKWQWWIMPLNANFDSWFISFFGRLGNIHLGDLVGRAYQGLLGLREVRVVRDRQPVPFVLYFRAAPAVRRYPRVRHMKHIVAWLKWNTNAMKQMSCHIGSLPYLEVCS